MKEALTNRIGTESSKKNSIMYVVGNQHPVMYWWFAITSISLCSVYVMLFTTF